MITYIASYALNSMNRVSDVTAVHVNVVTAVDKDTTDSRAQYVDIRCSC